MAFDIAVLQEKYGANPNWQTGNDTYFLPTLNEEGTFYSCIWDADGVDTISAQNATVGSTINLNDATLLYESGGGGFISFVDEIHGGFTIANGVIIENAIGGSGADLIVGNQADNILAGGDGMDSLEGASGDDTLFGDADNDELIGGMAKINFTAALVPTGLFSSMRSIATRSTISMKQTFWICASKLE